MKQTLEIEIDTENEKCGAECLFIKRFEDYATGETHTWCLAVDDEIDNNQDEPLRHPLCIANAKEVK
jgi:hypothetical protein